MLKKSLIQKTVIAAGVLIFLFLVYLSFEKRIYHFDGSESLRNSMAIVEGSSQFYITRPPLVSLLNTPLFFFYNYLAPQTILILSSLLHLFITGVLIYLSYLLFTRYHSRLVAVILSFLLLSNRFILHFSLEAKEGIPAAVLLLLAFFFYLEFLKKKSATALILCGVIMGISIAARRNMPLFLAGFSLGLIYHRLDLKGGFSSLFSRKNWRLVANLGILALATVVIALITHIGYYYLFTGNWSSAVKLLIYFKQDFSNVLSVHSEEAVYEYFLFLIAGSGIPLTILFFVGLYSSFKKHLSKDIEMLASTLLFLAIMSMLLHKEGRYLIPCLPFIYHFMGRGMTTLFEFTQKLTYKKQITGVAILILLLSYTYRTGMEILTLRDPFYRYPLPQKVAKYLEENCGDKKLYFVHHGYQLYPKKWPAWYHMIKYDPEYHISVLYNQILTIYTGRKIRPLTTDHHIDIVGEYHPVLLNSLVKTSPNACLIYGRLYPRLGIEHEHNYNTPLIVGNLKRVVLEKKGSRWQSPEIEIGKNKDGKFVVKAQTFPWELYIRRKGKLRQLGLVVSPDSIRIYRSNKILQIPFDTYFSDVLKKDPPSIEAVGEERKKFYRWQASPQRN